MPSDGETMIFKQMITSYLLFKRSSNYQQETLDKIQGVLLFFYRFIMRLGVHHLEELTNDILYKYLDVIIKKKNERKHNKDLAISTKKYKLQAVVQYLEYVREYETLNCNPQVLREYNPRERKLYRDALSEEKIQKIFNSINDKSTYGFRDKVIFQLLYSSGIRKKELLNLKVQDINLQEKTLFVEQGKNSKDRVVAIGKKLTKTLQEYIEKTRLKLQKYRKK